MKVTISKVGLAAPLLAAAVALAVSAPQTSTPEIMRDKLDRAQQLLSALVLGELQEVGEHAEEIHRLAELQSWYVLPTPEYAEHSRAFREAMRAVSRAAAADDPEASSESYFAGVRECVACHEDMGRVRAAGQRPPGP